jgi:hypothetical protein
MSPSATSEQRSPANAWDDHDGWPALPVETEIYILPDGQVVIADLPEELAGLAAHLGSTEEDE